MNKLITLVLVFITTVSFSQESRTNWTFSEVVEVPNVTKDELYIRGKSWFAKTFKSANNVIQMDDKDAGKIIGKGAIMIESNCTICGASGIHTSNGGPVSFTIEVSFKDNKFKYDITGLTHSAKSPGGNLENEKPDCGGMAMTKKTWAAIKTQTEEKVLAMITSLKTAETSAAKSEEW
jgi:hypothetical protein